MISSHYIEGIASVSDGDGLTIDNTAIDLFGIDAPAKETPNGTAAADFLYSLIEGMPVVAHCYGTQRSNRPACMVAVDGEDVGLKMLESGSAFVYEPTIPIYRAAVGHARKYSIGIWSSLPSEAVD